MQTVQSGRRARAVWIQVALASLERVSWAWMKLLEKGRHGQEGEVRQWEGLRLGSGTTLRWEGRGEREGRFL